MVTGTEPPPSKMEVMLAVESLCPECSDGMGKIIGDAVS
jgi:hypothetical protein